MHSLAWPGRGPEERTLEPRPGGSGECTSAEVFWRPCLTHRGAQGDQTARAQSRDMQVAAKTAQEEKSQTQCPWRAPGLTLRVTGSH